VLGAIILEWSQLQFAYHFGASRLYLIFYAAVFLLVIRFLPRGIVPSLTDLVARWRRGRAAGPPGPARDSAEPPAPVRHGLASP
jgi:branched-chain amino acid transport system permease protein